MTISYDVISIMVVLINKHNSSFWLWIDQLNSQVIIKKSYIVFLGKKTHKHLKVTLDALRLSPRHTMILQEDSCRAQSKSSEAVKTGAFKAPPPTGIEYAWDINDTTLPKVSLVAKLKKKKIRKRPAWYMTRIIFHIIRCGKYV